MRRRVSHYSVMPHDFDITLDNAVPPRMTDDEARAVIALWQSEQMDSPQSARPTPADMAEGLGIGTADAVRLLGQVRAARDAERQAALTARQEELARAETEARLAEARARQAEAKVRESRAKSDAHRARQERLRARRLSKYAWEPRVSPPTLEEQQAAAEHDARVRVWEQRWSRFGWLIFTATLLILAMVRLLHH